MAARSLIQLFRNLNPALLQRKHRGKPTEFTKELKPQQYGAVQVPSFIPGAECLDAEEPVAGVERDPDETSDDDDDESGSWVDVSSEEEDGGSENDAEDKEKTEKNEISEQSTAIDPSEETEAPIDPSEKAEIVSSSRILTDEEFRRIEAYQLSKKLMPVKGKKRKAAPSAEDALRKSDFPRLSDIEKLYKKPRQDKEARVASVRTGHDEREKFGKPKKKDHAGKTNKANTKNKVFSMVKHKQGGKKKRSFHQKQIALKNYLMKQKKMK